MFVELEHPIYGPVKITGTPLKFRRRRGRSSISPHFPASTTRGFSWGCYVALLGSLDRC